MKRRTLLGILLAVSLTANQAGAVTSGLKPLAPAAGETDVHSGEQVAMAGFGAITRETEAEKPSAGGLAPGGSIGSILTKEEPSG